HIPSNDFSLYDQVLDMTATLGCVPDRYNWDGHDIGLDLYFAMARGSQTDGRDVIACEMTKWFDTNYHYIVPEFKEDQEFKLSSSKIFDEYTEAKRAGTTTRPVIIGPVTYLSLGKLENNGDTMSLLDNILPVYKEIFQKLSDMNVEWVQVDEPFLTLDLSDTQKEAYKRAYSEISTAFKGNILLTSYFEGLRDNMDLALSLPVEGIHLDLKRAKNELAAVLDKIQSGKYLSLGLVDGRYIWKNNLAESLALVEKAVNKLGHEKIMVSSSSSLLHVPIDLDLETKMDDQIKSWMAFAKQKLAEISILAKGARDGAGEISEAIAESDKIAEERRTSPRIHNGKVKERLANVTPDMSKRRNEFAKRQKAQEEALNLPAYPTTTIGSFPQTQDIRKKRATFKKGDISIEDYERAMKAEIEQVVRYQEEIDMDMLVHGEAERNDMVEYFGEQLDGYIFSKLGWVQSYGSRCVKPPIIYGDVSRPKAMTVVWSKFAQSLTDRPMKGMLTGPITILFWSFKRDDVTLETSCRQIALAIRDEVSDLEASGIQAIQVDEPAIREGLPLRRDDWKAYLDWAVDSFKLATCSVQDETQIHTHMCYSEFNDIIEAIAALDADVISIETSRSQMELLDAFVNYNYPNEIGPGVYDIHSPRIPTKDEMVALLQKAAKVIDPALLWVNPDCGLKTRGWEEVKPALENMIAAAREMRHKAGNRKTG
ncbi:MAG: 5-methyltetrahydropteroyltriglutamate--homocysteine S-methyltransferase, partial [Alphaproteobacteria bacterium]|nr:5-methyltetrahydropteroyltriglutamate--homocysteine S-methyltransferase [Alphaproteobacteria bacterium]